MFKCGRKPPIKFILLLQRSVIEIFTYVDITKLDVSFKIDLKRYCLDVSIHIAAHSYASDRAKGRFSIHFVWIIPLALLSLFGRVEHSLQHGLNGGSHSTV